MTRDLGIDGSKASMKDLRSTDRMSHAETRRKLIKYSAIQMPRRGPGAIRLKGSWSFSASPREFCLFCGSEAGLEPRAPRGLSPNSVYSLLATLDFAAPAAVRKFRAGFFPAALDLLAA